MFKRASLTIGVLLLASQAAAAPVPPETERLIRAATPAQIDVVAAVAKTANPNSAAEIDALVASIKATLPKQGGSNWQPKATSRVGAVKVRSAASSPAATRNSRASMSASCSIARG